MSSIINQIQKHSSQKQAVESAQSVYGSFCEIMRVVAWERSNSFILQNSEILENNIELQQNQVKSIKQIKQVNDKIFKELAKIKENLSTKNQ